MKSAIIKQNLTEKNREKITKFLQKNINQEDNILLVKNEYEDKDQVLNDINNNLVFDYNIYNNSNTDNKLLLDYLNKHFTTNLDQFLKQKGFNVSKNPFVRTEITNKIDNEMFEDNLVKVGFINFLEVDNKKSFLSENIIKEFEVYLMDKLKLIFDIDLQMLNYEDLQQEEEIAILEEMYVDIEDKIKRNIDNYNGIVENEVEDTKGKYVFVKIKFSFYVNDNEILGLEEEEEEYEEFENYYFIIDRNNKKIINYSDNEKKLKEEFNKLNQEAGEKLEI